MIRPIMLGREGVNQKSGRLLFSTLAKSTAVSMTVITLLICLLSIDVNAIVIHTIPTVPHHHYHHHHHHYHHHRIGVSSSIINYCGSNNAGRRYYSTTPSIHAIPTSSWRLTAVPPKITIDDDDDGIIDAIAIPTIRDERYSNKDTNKQEDGKQQQRRKEELLHAITSTKLGFDPNLTPSDRARLSTLADAVVADGINNNNDDDNNHRQNLRLVEGSSWKLLYGDAPDILGLRGGPLSRLVSIRQEVSSLSSLSTTEDVVGGMRRQTLEVILEYAPSESMMGLIGRLPQFIPSFGEFDITQDRLEQSVFLDCQQGDGDGDGDGDDAGILELRPRGTSIRGTRFGGTGNILPAFNLQDEGDILASLPIALSCRIVYNDGDLRIDRSQVDQGNYLGIYRRIR